MWRFLFLAALGVIIGSRARTERGIIAWAVFLGLLYGGLELGMVAGPLSKSRVVMTLVLGLVMAAPVYAVAELWRRARLRVWAWLRRFWPGS